MTRDDMHDLVLGAAVLLLGYALYKHHQAELAAAQPRNTGIVAPTQQPQSAMNNLLAGTVHDLGGGVVGGMAPDFMGGFMQGFMR